MATFIKHGACAKLYTELQKQEEESSAKKLSEQKKKTQKKVVVVEEFHCTRCFRGDLLTACKTHNDDTCRHSFCENCYAFATKNNTGKRVFLTHDDVDCIHLARKAEAQKEKAEALKQKLEHETEGEMNRRLKKERAIAFRQKKATTKPSASNDHAEPIFRVRVMTKVASESADGEEVVPVVAPVMAKAPEEAKAIWKQKALETIALTAKEAEEEKVRQLQKEEDEKAKKKAEEEAKIAKIVEQIGTAKKNAESKIAEKKSRLESIRARLREAKERVALEKKMKKTQTQKKKEKQELSNYEREAQSLTIEIIADQRHCQESIRKLTTVLTTI